MSNQKTIENPPYLDDDERDIIEAVERGEFKSIDNFKESKKELEAMARNTFKSRKKQLGIRLHPSDILEIQKNAEFMGIPYQTLISSVLHQYAQGTLELVTKQDEHRTQQSLKSEKKEISQIQKV